MSYKYVRESGYHEKEESPPTTVTLGLNTGRPISRYGEEEVPILDTSCADSHAGGPMGWTMRHAAVLLSWIRHARQNAR